MPATDTPCDKALCNASTAIAAEGVTHNCFARDRQSRDRQSRNGLLKDRPDMFSFCSYHR